MENEEKGSVAESLKEDQPPIFGTWNKLYVFVLIFHALLILLFYLFTKAFS
jgi:hypothetical protein